MAEIKKEHRRHKRYEVNDCMVQCKTPGFLKLLCKTSKKWPVHDISPYGIQFIAENALEEKTQLTLIITAPFLKDKRIQAQGKVIRVNGLPESAGYSIGIEFADMNPDDRNNLEHLMDNIG